MDDEVVGQAAIGQPIRPEKAMALAIREARKGHGYVSPNPVVGCTIVDKDHRLLSVGYHGRIGGDHAEIDAIRKAGDPSKLQGAHFYVTLEPCAHQGRTPSCARALVPYKPASVTYAVEDPFPQVAGKGAKILREGGVKAQLLKDREDLSLESRDELTEAAEDLAEIFLYNQRSGEPFIAVKVASTLDGKMALTSGESKWITGELARNHVHKIRARYDAVAIGSNTLVADDPSLNVRHSEFPGFENKAVVFDPEGRTLSSIANANLLRVRPPESVIVVVGAKSGAASVAGVRALHVPTDDSGFFSMSHLVAGLKAEGLTSILIEGGAQTIGAFFRSENVRRLHLYMAPALLGGRHGLAWSTYFGVETIADRIRLVRSEREILGEDLYWTARVRRANH